MPTYKQKQAFKAVLNGTTKSQAMIKAGYAPTTASSTGKLTRTKGWKDLMDEYLPDKLLGERHRELLNKREKNDEPETQAVGKALEMAYKLKGRFADSPSPLQTNPTLIQIVINTPNAKSSKHLSNRKTARSMVSSTKSES